VNDPNEWTNLAQDPSFSKIKNKFQKWLPKTDAEDAPDIVKKSYKAKIKKFAAEKGMVIE